MDGELVQALWSLLTNPNVVYALLIVGLWATAAAFYVPGTGLMEVAAALCLVLAVAGLTQLPVNVMAYATGSGCPMPACDGTGLAVPCSGWGAPPGNYNYNRRITKWHTKWYMLFTRPAARREGIPRVRKVRDAAAAERRLGGALVRRSAPSECLSSPS